MAESGMSQEMMDEERMKTIGLFISSAIEAEGNFLHVYDIIIDKVENKEMKQQLQKFDQDHRRHVQDLKDVATEIGVEVPVRDPAPTALGEALGKKVEGLSDEKKILKEFLVSENFSRNFYEMAMGTELDIPAQAVEVMRRAHEDETRHHEWAMKQLKRG